MFTVPVPFTEAFFTFALPLPTWSRWLRLGLVLLVAAAFVVALVWLYRRELAIASRRVARALLLLRCSTVMGVFLVLGLQPALVCTAFVPVPSRVLIAVDRSDSMRTVDAHTPLTEQALLAAALKFPNLNGVSRLQIAERLLDGDGGDVLKQLAEKHTLEFVAFDNTIQALPLDEAAWRKQLQAERKVDPATPTNLLSSTDMKLPLVRAVESAAQSETSKLVGVVVLSDGRHNWGDGPEARAAELQALKLPIYPVLLGPRNAPADVAVTLLKPLSATVFKGSSVPVEVAVRVTGWPADVIDVELQLPPDERGKARPPIKERLPHNGEDQTYQFTLAAKLESTGPQRLTLTATPRQGEDKFPANNRRTASIKVVKDRARVLLIDGEARWEFHYLHTALGRDENMDVRSTVFRQPRITKATDEELKKFGTPALTLPELDVLSNYDCVILGDVEQNQLLNVTNQLINWDWLEKYVAEDGGTLVIAAGKRGMPLQHLQENSPLRRLLPIANPKVLNVNEGFRLNLTADGERSWFLQLGDTLALNRNRWNMLSPHYWAITGDAKPGAEVLLTAQDRPIVARQNYGFGRVLYLGLDSTWRWRFRYGDLFHHKFWGQVAQWAASDRLLPTQNATGTIRFGTREPSFRFGAPVEVVVRASEAVKKLGPTALKGVRLLKFTGADAKPASTISLRANENNPRILTAQWRELPPGKYAIELEIPEWADQLQGTLGADGRVQSLRSEFEVLPPENEEFAELSADVELMQKLADTTGGKLFTADQYEALVRKLNAQEASVEQRATYPARTSWLTMIVIVLLLSAEWALRKWAGLV